MRSDSRYVSYLFRGLVAAAGLVILAGCGGGSSSSTTPTSTPSISLSPSSLTFSGQFVGTTSTAQSVTVSNPGTATLTFSGIAASGDFAETNTCGTGIAASGICTVDVTFTPTATGARTGTLTITDNASGSPHTVSLAGTGTSVSLSPTSLIFTGVTVSQTSAPQTVTLHNTNSSALAISSVAITSGSPQFAETNTCGASVAASGSCQINVTYTPSATGTVTGTLTVTDNADGSAGSTQVVNLSGTSTGSNSVPVSVNFGPNGYTTTAESYYNGIFTSVTVCEPGTSTCATVPNVLVDTGSSGLRLLSSAVTGVTLPQINDGQGDNLDECYEFGSFNYTWGPVDMATVQLGGEVASQVPAASGGTANAGIPIQLIASGTPPAQALASCTFDGGLNMNTVGILGANGILGVGNDAQDCGPICASGVNNGPYIACSTSTNCVTLTQTSLQDQVWNPVPAFTSADTNGVVLQLPSVPSGGSPSVTGTLYFGIGTDPDNAIPGGAQIYELDGNGNFPTLTYNGVNYSSAAFLDSGSNALFVSDPTTLSNATGATVTNCADNAYYCTTAPLSLNITLLGSNNTTSPTETLSIVNADTLLNSTDAALNNLGGSSGGTDATTDYWDLGLPFFYNRTIFVNVAGSDSTYPNGYWAF
jgi:hypothetical protein